MRERQPRVAQRPGFTELLFDAAFVLALSQLSATIFLNRTWASVGRELVLVVAFWFLWAFTASMTNRMDPRRAPAQTTLILVMLGVTIMGASATDAFLGRYEGLLFAAIFVAIQLARTLYIASALRQGRYGFVSLIGWFLFTAALWIAGGLHSGESRTVYWAAAVALTFLMARNDFWLPWHGVATIGELRVSREYMAERYQQIIVIALGDKILSAGLTLSGYEFKAAPIITFVVSFVTTILLWRMYFYRAGSLIAETIVSTPSRIRLGEKLSLAHLVMFAGIIVSSAGDKIIVASPSLVANLLTVVIIAGGPALFLLGQQRMLFLTFGRASRSRLVGLVTLAAMTPITISLRVPVVTIVVNVVLAGIVLADTIAELRHPHRPEPPT